jgi:hypothetical protein
MPPNTDQDAASGSRRSRRLPVERGIVGGTCRLPLGGGYGPLRPAKQADLIAAARRAICEAGAYRPGDGIGLVANKLRASRQLTT